ncbi:MAG: AAA family ATPase [Anaerolineae bacterium]|nr:AAA family ATPase [Anaerolineae bacterium]
MTSSLLRTKTYVPAVRAKVVSRPRLIERLNAGRKLTLVSAPAGFGKTTLVSEWLRQLEHPAAWLSLDRDDNDPIRFWQYVVAALQTVDDSIGRAAQAALQSPRPPALEALVTALINDLAATPRLLILVLDDYHVIEAKAIHDSLDFLLDHLPAQLRLVITTRADPPLSLPRRRGRSELVEVRMAHLRFRVEEAVEFLNACVGLDISPEDVAALDNRVEGWIVGLQMAALAMKAPLLQEGSASSKHEFVVAFAGDDRHVADYLMEEVLQRQPAHVQTFLLQTSILERLCGPLCDAVTGEDDGQAMLTALEQTDLFIVPLDNRRQWYRYHALFADLLRWRLRQSAREGDAVEVGALHLRASRWYEREGFIADAVSHALAAADFEYATDLIERHILAAFLRSEVPLVHSWLKALPEDLLRTRPMLCAFYALSTLLAPPYGAEAAKLAGGWLQEAENGLAAPAGDMDQTTRDMLAVYVAVFRAYQARIHGDEPQTAVELSSRALELLPEDSLPIRSALVFNLGVAYQALDQDETAEETLAEARQLAEACGNYYIACLATRFQAAILRKHGRLHEAVALCRETIQAIGGSGQEERHFPVLGVVYVTLGEILLEWNDLEEADRALAKGLELNALTSEWHLQMLGHFALSHVKQAQGDLDEASAVLERARALSPRAASQVAYVQVALQLAQAEDDPRRLAAVSRWLQERGVDLGSTAFHWRRSAYDEKLVLVRLLIAQRRAHQSASGRSAGSPPNLQPVLRFLDAQRQLAEEGDRVEWSIRLSVLQALAWQALGNTPSALDALEHALALAEPGGYVRTFLDGGTAMVALLCQAKAQKAMPDYVDKLLAAFGEMVPGEPPHPGAALLIEPLTPRENEVLQLLAAGASNAQIAEELFITVNTVKRHITHILGKLGVENRTQAAMRARELGLISES